MTFRDFIIACLLPLGITAVAHSAPPPVDGGIWKAIVPPGPMKAEFDGYDPIGVATGHRIQADCSLNWVSPDDGARYCFSSGTSLEFFLDRPQEYIRRARENWTRMHRQ
jgi:YHS domain-containing protein